MTSDSEVILPSAWRRKAEKYRRDGWEVLVVPVFKAPEDPAGLLDFVQQYVWPD